MFCVVRVGVVFDVVLGPCWLCVVVEGVGGVVRVV